MLAQVIWRRPPHLSNLKAFGAIIGGCNSELQEPRVGQMDAQHHLSICSAAVVGALCPLIDGYNNKRQSLGFLELIRAQDGCD